ncbi:unnamed protein product [Owenia fusiformis]|uniref:Uncharacterized protein n=1 Tax=Owenia fusiformis TaxID=6347 RepID=A0A8J1T768_OWEFU|nr:unnamed protein product [Owenia fusiformis]
MAAGCGWTRKAKSNANYSWLVVLGSLCSNVLMHGISWSVGVFFVLFLGAFQQSKGKTAWTGSINTACMYGIGPVASMLTNKLGYRTTMMIGGVVAAIGLATSALSTNIYHLYITFGFLTGCGLGICYIPTITVLAVYFSKNLTLAVGLSSSGVGIGMFLYPPLITTLTAIFGWRGCMLILAAITFNICVCGAIMRPKNISDDPTRRMKDDMHDDIEYKSVAEATDDTTVKNVSTETTVFNARVFLNLNFMIMCMTNFLYCIGHSILYVHFAEYAITIGIEPEQAAFLFSIIGFSNLVGKFIFGALSTIRHPCTNVILLYGSTFAITGLLMLTVPLQNVYPLLVSFAVVFGMCSAAFGVFAPEIVRKFLGQKDLSTGYGLLCICCAAGILPGAPIAGMMFDRTQQYAGSFYLGGTVIALSGISMLIPYIRTRNIDTQNDDEDVSTDDFIRQSLLDVAQNYS